LKFCPKEFPKGYPSLPRPVPELEINPVVWGAMCFAMTRAGSTVWDRYHY